MLPTAGADIGRPGSVRPAVQAAPYQARLHAGGRRPGPRHALWQRLLADDDLSLRGAAAELQEHVQVEAAAGEVVGRG